MHRNTKLSEQESSFLKIYKAEIILLIVTFSWGLSFPLIKVSLQFISPAFFIFLRFVLTLIFFLILFRKKINLSNYNEWKYGIILGIFLFGGFAFQTLGLKYTTASKSAFITGTNLIVIPFAQYFLINKKPKPENIAGAVLVIAGLFILSEAYMIVPNIGDLLTIICAVCFALHIVLLDKYSQIINFNYLVLGQFLTMSVLSFIFMMFVEVFIDNALFLEINSSLIITLAYTTIFSTLASIVLMTKYQKLTTPLRAGIIYNMESIFAVFFAFIILGEILNFNQIVGAIIMFAGLLISEFYGYFKFKINAEKC